MNHQTKAITVACAWHIENFSANRIFRDGKWFNISQAEWNRLLETTRISHGICPSCERLVMLAEAKDDAFKRLKLFEEKELEK